MTVGGALSRAVPAAVTRSLSDFLDAWSDDACGSGVGGVGRRGPSRVWLSTVHAAKGLEWPLVWVAAAEGG
eukprot:625798-Prymnesium_polylepis.1